MTDFLPAWSEPFYSDPPDIGASPALGLGIDRRWAYGDGSGRGVRVAIVDSGVDASHPAVGGVHQAVEVLRDPEGEAAIFVEGPHDDLYGHGTACAGIIRALAPEVELISVRVLGDNLKGSAFNFSYGLEWCIDNGVDVVNLSLSTSNDDYVDVFFDLLDHAVFADVMLVSALNNEPKRSIPSEFSGVFGVACAPVADREHFMFNRNAPAEWAALGMDVDVAWSAGSTITASGNSFAAPVIAGHIARIVGAHPGVTPWQVRTILAELAGTP